MALAVLVWLPSLGAPPLIDERVMTYEARKWIGLDGAAPWFLPIGGSGTWRPLTTYAFWIDAGLPWPLRHAVQLLLHAAFVALAVVWLRARTSTRGAMIGGCFLAVHASHAATAGWIGGRADLGMALCAVGALVAWDRDKAVLATVLTAAAVLFKETGIVLVLLLVFARPRGESRTWWALPGPAVAGGAVFLGSLALANVDGSYWPTGATLGRAGRLWAPFVVELAVPWFVPLGVPSVPRDLIGIALAVPVCAGFVYFGLGREQWHRGVAMAAVALLPVMHVLPNDGGQWYLLLPSLGVALAWADLASVPALRRAVVAVVAITAVAATYEAVAWQRAAVRLEASIAAQIDEPTREDPRLWPHRGPSFCCGVPYQVQEDPPRGWGPISEPVPGAP